MTLVLLDGCEDYSSWTVVGSNLSIGAGRNGNAFQFAGSPPTTYQQFDISAADQTDTLTLGCAYRYSSSVSQQAVIAFVSDGGAAHHGSLQWQANTLFWQRGVPGWTTTNTLTTWPAVFVDGTWYYIEVSVKLSDTVGTTALRINGALITPTSGAQSGLDTKNGGSKTVFDTVRLLGGSSANIKVDDLYVTNDLTVLGDIAVSTLLPNGNGSTSQWAGSDGNSTDNYLLVDEAGTPDQGDYVSSNTAGQQDLYTMTDLPAGLGTVRAVYHAAHAIKTDSGSRQLKLAQRGAATNVGPAMPLTTSFVNVGWGLTTNPETGAAFTRAEVNALQSGVECA